MTNVYKSLIKVSSAREDLSLPRSVYYILDEFGNMPKFPEFGSIMTVGRSRGIFFELCVQSYSQLYQVYGPDEGKPETEVVARIGQKALDEWERAAIVPDGWLVCVDDIISSFVDVPLSMYVLDIRDVGSN